MRAFFLRHHFGVETDYLGRQTWRRPRGRPPAGWWRWWLRGVGWGLLGLADWSERRYAWLGGALVDLQLFKRLEGELEQVYVFALYDRRQYLLLTFLARHTRLAVTAVYQNIPLARNCRHLHVPVPVVLTSKVNLCEADYYRAQGSFLPSAVTYASQEFALDTHDLRPAEPLYDIGYYSSGEWARREGLYQVPDVERIRRGEFAGNTYARAAAAQLAALAGYAHSEGRTLRIYPHPLERRLTRHGVEPPYAALVDGETVTVDDGARRDLATHHLREPRGGLVAVVVHLGAARPGARRLVPARVRRPDDERLRTSRAGTLRRQRLPRRRRADRQGRRGPAPRPPGNRAYGPLITPWAAADLPALRRRPARAASGTASSATGSPSRLTPP